MRRFLIASLVLLAPAWMFAQGGAGAVPQSGLDPARILQPLGDQWPTYSGDYTSKRYSSLALINQSTVNDLSLAWVASVDGGTGVNGASAAAAVVFGRAAAPATYSTIVSGFGDGSLNTGGPADVAGSILMVDGVLYVSAADNAWALDARDGTILWHFYWKTRGGTHTGNRGMAMYHNWLYLEVPDDMLISLDAATGQERWEKPISSFAGQYFSSSSPVVIGNHVLVGTGDDLDAPGFLQSFDPVTGARQWIHYDVPMNPGDPGLDTWPSLDAARHGGGQAWMVGAYDPETHLYVYGTGNPTPAYTTGRGSGDNLYTCSLIAVNVDTGKMAWYFQTSPHDTHDWDSTETPIMVDAPFHGQMRKLLLQASRNGYFFVLDRVTGEHLLTSKLGLANNWAKGVRADGEPDRNPEKDATIPGSLVNGDVLNYPPPTFDPQTGLFYVHETNSLRLSYLIDADPRGSMGLGGTTGGAGFSYGDAIDYQTGKVVWRHQVSGSPGLLTTAGHLLFANDGDYLVAYDPVTGKSLWHSRIGEATNTPETYMLDGKQYLLSTGGGRLFAFVLNSQAASAGSSVAGR